MLQDKLTIVTPTLNRHAFLKRMLDYYKQYDVAIVAVDGSRERFPLADSYPNLSYFHKDEIAMDRFIFAVNAVETPFLLPCPDDALMSYEAMKQCVAFLESNPDYSGVEGYQASLYYKDNGFVCKVGRSMPVDIASDSVIDRMLTMVAYGPQFWRFWRTSACRDAFNGFPHHKYQEFHASVLCEFVLRVATTITGKFRSLPLFFSLHEDVKSVQRRDRKGFSFWDFCSQEEYRDLYEEYLEDIVTFVLKYDSMPPEVARHFCERMILSFASGKRNSVVRKTFATRLRNELRSAWNKTLGKRAFAQRKHLQREEAMRLNDARLAGMAPGCREEMDRAADFIFNYPRCVPNKS